MKPIFRHKSKTLASMLRLNGSQRHCKPRVFRARSWPRLHGVIGRKASMSSGYWHSRLWFSARYHTPYFIRSISPAAANVRRSLTIHCGENAALFPRPIRRVLSPPSFRSRSTDITNPAGFFGRAYSRSRFSESVTAGSYFPLPHPEVYRLQDHYSGGNKST